MAQIIMYAINSKYALVYCMHLIIKVYRNYVCVKDDSMQYVDEKQATLHMYIETQNVIRIKVFQPQIASHNTHIICINISNSSCNRVKNFYMVSTVHNIAII